MAVRALAEPECGGDNALVRLSSLVTGERVVRHGVGQRSLFESGAAVDSVLDSSSAPTSGVAVDSFRMSGLISQLPRVQQSCLARSWCNEFIASARPTVAPTSSLTSSLADPTTASYEQLQQQQQLHHHQQLQQQQHQQLHQQHQQQHYHLPMYRMMSSNITATKAPANPLDQIQWLNQSCQVDASRVVTAAPQVATAASSSQLAAQPTDCLITGDRAVQSGSACDTTVGGVVDDDVSWLDETDMAQESREELWSRLEREWCEMWKAEALDTVSRGNEEYQFGANNPYTELADPLAEGRRRWRLGDVPGAVLCFEAAARRQPQLATAWQLLGQCLAENEQDPQAICALRHCVRLEPANADANMALATCYANESYPQQACRTLQDWLSSHVDYQHLVKPSDVNSQSQPVTSTFQHSLPDRELQQRVSDALLAAVQLRAPAVDADLQCALGTLLHIQAEYERAAECFSAAVTAKPESAQLWNKLGATLANGARPELAVGAYHRALSLAPGFIRARYNLGISCRALGAHREAAEQFVGALCHQCRGHQLGRTDSLLSRDSSTAPATTATTESTAAAAAAAASLPPAAAAAAAAEVLSSISVMSQSIWSALAVTVAALQRPDLATHVQQRNLAALSEEFGISLSSSPDQEQ